MNTLKRIVAGLAVGTGLLAGVVAALGGMFLFCAGGLARSPHPSGMGQSPQTEDALVQILGCGAFGGGALMAILAIGLLIYAFARRQSEDQETASN